MILRASHHTSDMWHLGKISHRKHKKTKYRGQSWYNELSDRRKDKIGKILNRTPIGGSLKIDFIVKLGPYLRCKHARYCYRNGHSINVIERPRYIINNYKIIQNFCINGSLLHSYSYTNIRIFVSYSYVSYP